MTRTFRFRYLIRLALVISLLAPVLTPFASQIGKGREAGFDSSLQTAPEAAFGEYDIRRRQVVSVVQGPTARQLAALGQLQGRVKELQIRFDPVMGTPRHLFSLAQRLTRPRRDDPVVIARDFLTTNQSLFRLEDREIADLVVAKDYRTEHNGVAHVVFKQFYRGLDVFQGDIKVNLDRDGQILSVNGNYFPGLEVALSPDLAVDEAVRIAAHWLAPDLDFMLAFKSLPDGVEQATVFDRGPFTQDITAKLVVFPAYDRARLAWQVRLHLMDQLAWYDTLIDAHSGEILFRHNLYQFSDPKGLVFSVHPDRGPQVLRSFSGDPIASPSTWVASPPNRGTLGNNVFTLPLAQHPEQAFNFPFGDTYQREGVNVFDLDARTLRFTRNAGGGYDVNLSPLRFDSDLGRDFTSRLGSNRDDGFAFLPLPFAFPFFNTSFNSAFINANGNVTFNGGNQDASESWADLILGLPRIAALWDDLDLTRLPEGGGLFIRSDADRVVITWNQVPQFNLSDASTVQLRLFADGAIEVAFDGVSLTDAIVGISPGNGDFELQPVDFSVRERLTGSPAGLAEKFPTRDLDASITNLFYHLNFMHDYLYDLGFDEPAGNFQLENFGRSGAGNDPVLAWPQHAGFNNAFFGTPEDGSAPFTGYFFFTSPPFRQVDSALDADVIYHEYVHGLTNRLVGNRFNVGALSSRQGGAMGEGWGDIYAASITNDPIVAEFSTGNAETGIRRVNYALSPLVYGDFGNRRGPLTSFGVSGGIALNRTFIPEVHFDGEIWASTLWDLRGALGKRRFEQLITDALKFTPSIPSMLDARDAILIADVASTGGANQTIIWSVFAARGMGISARSENGDDTIVFQAFDTPWNPLPPGRETIFFDNMAQGENGWTVAGDDGVEGSALWHISRRRGTSWYYGIEDAGHYDTGGRNFGALTSPVIDLPTLARNSALTLEFDYFFRGDLSSSTNDNGYVRMIDTTTGEIQQIASISNNSVGRLGSDSFQSEALDISAFVGRSIQIQFYFDTLTRTRNMFEGWYIDNVRVSRRVP